ncbi:hypothetical protein GY45DRAFT_1321134 [Cubamyces sp. BRFM 1775]|nr:hypothetical protein GY45DRAFT_1321134 [Cubamyces sp. BRFM 1775]
MHRCKAQAAAARSLQLPLSPQQTGSRAIRCFSESSGASIVPAARSAGRYKLPSQQQRSRDKHLSAGRGQHRSRSLANPASAIRRRTVGRPRRVEKPRPENQREIAATVGAEENAAPRVRRLRGSQAARGRRGLAGRQISNGAMWRWRAKQGRFVCARAIE